MGKKNRKLIILDECHAFSKAAWQSLLKMVEEPPEHLFFALCTTELTKVPDTIVNRCYHVALKPLRDSEIEDLVLMVCDVEEWEPAGDIIQMIVHAATGQPRKALSILQAVHDAPSREEAQRIVSLTEASKPMSDLFNAVLIGKNNWVVIRPILERIPNDEFEDAAIHGGRYLMGALLKESNEKKASHIWQMLEALMYPSSTFDKKAAFVAAVGRMIWAQA